MFLQRQHLTRRKIIGGNLLGNLFNKAKSTLYNTSKILLPKAKALGKITAQKALTAAKEQVTPEAVYDLAQDIMRKDKKAVKKKLNTHSKKVMKKLAQDEQLNPEVRDTIHRLSTNTNARKVLEKKGKELLQSQSRAILSNLVAGSGMKQL